LSSQGYTLNVSDIAMLNASLSKLQAEEKYGRIFFWGKIMGKSRDYYVAYGLRDKDIEFPSKQFYCATDESFEFADLPTLTDEEREAVQGLGLDAPFSGEADLPLFPKSEEDGEEAEENPLTELHRVSFAVESIDSETSVVPVQAYILNDAHQVVPSAEYAGLSWSDMNDLASYGHFRPATNIGKLRAMAKDDIEWKNSNFLDRLTGSLPHGCWAKRLDPANSSVQLRSLLWPGYVFYAVAEKQYFGSIYIGHGVRNNDLPFLL
jgi:radial spoke head protein 9